jgi:DNA-binding NarL/FixJ family response regulator
MRVLIVDDHTLFRKGLSALLRSDSRFGDIYDVSSAPEAIDFLLRQSVDLVSIDISLEKSSGLDLVIDIKQLFPKQIMVVVTMFSHHIIEYKARNLGVSDFITKDVAPKVLRDRLLVAVHPSGNPIYQRAGHSDFIAKLSARQLDVFRLMGGGKTTLEIADLLLISPKTVESHRRRLKNTLKVDHISQLIALAAREFPEG